MSNKAQQNYIEQSTLKQRRFFAHRNYVEENTRHNDVEMCWYLPVNMSM